MWLKRWSSVLAPALSIGFALLSSDVSPLVLTQKPSQYLLMWSPLGILPHRPIGALSIHAAVKLLKAA